MHETPNRRIDVLLVTLFALFLAAPVAKAVLDGWVPSHADARREPAPWPEAGAWRERAVGFEDWLDDRLGFRGGLVRAHSLWKVFGLSTSPVPQVLLGRDGWLFFNGGRDQLEGDRPVHQSRGARRLGDEERGQVLGLLVGRRKLFESLGIPFLLVFAPNKHSIYPEQLPRRYATTGGETPLDQVLADLERTGMRVVDLRPVLRQAKSQGLVYYRTNSHWNDLGAAVATRQILGALADWKPGLGVRLPGPWTVSWREEAGSNLARMLGLADRYRERVPVIDAPRAGVATRYGEEELFETPWFAERPNLRDAFREQGLSFSRYEQDDSSLPTALVLADSFGAWMMEPLSRSFRWSVYLHRQTPIALVRRVARDLSPDVVIEERVERSIVNESG